MVTLYPESILKLIQSFSQFPGIGKKTAERLSFYVLHASYFEVQALASNIIELKKKVKLCSICFALTDNETCQICSNQTRDKSVICVVENLADMAAIEKSGAFLGVYHILGGALSPLDGIGPDEIRIKELFLRAKNKKIKEIIIATGTHVEGEATASYISDNLKNTHMKISKIASGVPMGGDLKYVDQVTIQRAMYGRHKF